MKDIAKSCEMSKSMIDQLRAGSTGYSADTIEKLCNGLKCKPVDLFMERELAPPTRKELILEIQTMLSALDYNELRIVKSSIESLTGSPSALKSKTALAE